ncbi:hypothetical protein HBH52_169020 [Parastagonospora nodorum]|nr:hypothetical protein HBH52_169020 [Parastagonospora nodorum]KAH6193370.1 hypothetical protein HBI15_238140 [Parastagonospora nodorum]
MSTTENENAGEPPAPDQEVERTVSWEDMLKESPKEPEKEMFQYDKEQQLHFMANPTTPYETLSQIDKRKIAKNKEIELGKAMTAPAPEDYSKSDTRSVGPALTDKKSSKKVIVKFISQKNEVIDKDQTPAGRYGKSYICVPCGYMRGKIVSILPELDVATQLSKEDTTFTVSCPECFATYSTRSGRGKVSPQATDTDSITGLVELKAQGAQSRGKAPWVCLSCLGPQDDPENTDTVLQILYINNGETEKCVGCTELLKKENPGELVKGNTHFIALGQRRKYGL